MRVSTIRAWRWGLVPLLSGLLIAGCGGGSEGGSNKEKPTKPHGKLATEPHTLAASELRSLLLTADDLGSGYSQVDTPTDYGEVEDLISIEGCPELAKVSGQDGETMFASRAVADFSYVDGAAEIGQELYSDRPSVLSSKLRELFNAYTACPTYTIAAGSTPIKVVTSKVEPPQLGDEQFSYMTTTDMPEGPEIRKTIAVRKGSVAVILSGTPALVNAHMKTAYNKLPAN